MALIFVDCEAYGGCPATGQLTEFGAVHYPSRKTFWGQIIRSSPDPNNPAVPLPGDKPTFEKERQVFEDFEHWLISTSGKRAIMVSDNPAYDFMWIADGFWRTLGRNPFGHSARRISDFYAGLRGDFYETQKWKRLRVTPHDHNPVNDAMGNLEAFERLLKGER